MLAQIPSIFAVDWTALVVPGVGVVVAALVVVLMVYVGRWRRKRLGDGSKEEDLSWEDLLELLRRRRRERKAAGRPPDEELPGDELLQELMGQLPSANPTSTPEDQLFELPLGAERRTSPRRWGNPTEVDIISSLLPARVHGIVVNRSTGGLALLLDREVPAGTMIKVRSVEAPPSVPRIEVEVRYCKKAGKNYLIGCQFSEEIPWNVRVWFG